MQKTFIKYIFVIMTVAISLILLIHLVITFRSLTNQQLNSFWAKTDQVIHTLENNQRELALMNENLDEDYLTRARAAEYVLNGQQDTSMDVGQMQYLAKLLNVDEVHVIDENGFIVCSSVSQYIGIDMDDHEQTRAFLALLDSREEEPYLIQDAMPNAAENKVMKYVGVGRKGMKGIVQVGFEPIRQLELESRNTYEYIFSKFPTDVGEELFVVDRETGAVLGHSDGMEGEFGKEHYRPDILLGSLDGRFIREDNGSIIYVAGREYGDVLIGAALPGEILLQRLLKNALTTLVYLLLVEIAVILLLYYLVRRKVIDGIHQIIESLSAITEGNLDTAVTVGGNREFEQLSEGINTMVKSIVSISNRISAIIDISGIPLGAFEYKSGQGHVFVTSGVKGLLGIQEDQAALYRDSELFDRYIRKITRKAIEEEKDVFEVNTSKYVRIHMSETQEGYLGVITDVTGDILEKRRMQYENTHDPLTGLYQYNHFKQLAGDVLRGMPDRQMCAVVMLDLDSFKSINDTFGHNAGDRYLQTFSAVMKSMPKEHFLCARRSGDEFCMMVFGCREKSEITGFLDLFYEKLRASRVRMDDKEYKAISASGGFAWTRDPEESIYELLSHADEALYEVKRETKGHYTEYGCM
jgi:diguanylate cyclase (GGDEF)-like protein